MQIHKKRKKELTEEELRIKKEKKQTRIDTIKKIGASVGTAVVGIGALTAAGIAFVLNSSKDSNEEEHDRYYEPFADPNNPLYIEPDNTIEIDWDDDEDPTDESYAAEDYYSSILSVDED